MSAARPRTIRPPRSARPRVGFLGAGWIGRNRLAALAAAEITNIVAVADLERANAEEATRLCGGGIPLATLDQLLALDLDGVVIATPSALHAAQCIAALERGVAVFCQQPLGRDAGEVRAVLQSARTRDRLLSVDFPYRHVSGMAELRGIAQRGELGRIYAMDAEFHNAYGPDKPWYRDPAQAGGGCLMDLGAHLVDLAAWLLGHPRPHAVTARLFAGGRPLPSRGAAVEDHALAEYELDGAVAVRLACSWNLPAGTDAVIGLRIYGTQGGAGWRNLAGSFYDFTIERFHGARREALSEPPDEWSGRAIVDWGRRLAASPRFDRSAERLMDVAQTLDAIYEAHERRSAAVPV